MLWIDALCINQADGIEKTHQVGLMSEIYKNTWRALAWLGEFEEDVVLKPEMSLQAYGDAGVTIDKTHAQRAFKFVEKLSNLSTDGHFAIETENVRPRWVGVTEPDVDALQMLVSLKWFTRIWTVQELVLPPRMELVLGDITCEEALNSMVSKAAWNMSKHYHEGCCSADFKRLPELRGSLDAFIDRLPSLRRIRRHLPSDLDYLIHRFRYRYCADPRDKLFALLGLTRLVAREVVDYKLDKQQVYTEFLRYNMRLTNSPNSLIRVSERNRDASLPSWVPDFEAEIFDDPRAKVYWIEFNNAVFCCPLFSAGTKRAMELGSSKEDQLQLGGCRVDRIRRICKGPPQSQWRNKAFWMRMRTSWRALLESDPSLDWNSYPGGGTYAEAFWRTCTWDIQKRKDLDGQDRRIMVGEEEGVKKRLEQGAYGRGITPIATFFISHLGYIGIGPEDTRVGDMVYVLFGGCVPFILREVPEAQEISGTHTFVGHAYVHGIMDGEMLEKDVPDEQVILV